MGTSGFYNREVDATGIEISVFESATDETQIQKVAWTDDDGALIGATQTTYIFTLEHPHLHNSGVNPDP